MSPHVSSPTQAATINKLSISTLKNILRSILIAQTKLKDREVARDDLKKQISKVKKDAGKKISKVKMDKNLIELQNKVNNLLQKEAKLLRSSEYDNKTVAELKNKVKKMQEELLIKDSEKSNLLTLNKYEIKALKNTINSVKQKMENFIDEKTERERKVQELENRIREKVQLKTDINDRVKHLESKFSELRLREEHDEEDLNRIRERIDILKTEY